MFDAQSEGYDDWIVVEPCDLNALIFVVVSVTESVVRELQVSSLHYLP